MFIYDNPEVQKVEEDFQNTLAKCHKVTVTEVRNRGILMKTAGQVLRLVAPLMEKVQEILWILCKDIVEPR